MRTICADCSNLDGFDEESRTETPTHPKPTKRSRIAGLGLEIERAREDPAVGLSEEFEP